MDKLGLGYSALEKLNPGIIMVSITPFGQTGPYKDYKTSDIVAWALGGCMYPYGNADRAPVRISHYSQAYLLAGLEAAAEAMVAFYCRQMTGEGQHVDASIQESVVQANAFEIAFWDMMKLIVQREGEYSNYRLTWMWPCKDGYVLWYYFTGLIGARINRALVKWMDGEGMANDFLKSFDWEAWDIAETTQELIDRLEEPTGKFFLAHTKAELIEGAVKRHIMIYPVSASKDVLESAQLATRQFWVEVEHPELGTSITYPGAFCKASELPPRVWRRALLIGEYNQEIFEKELGISGDEFPAPGKAEGYPAKPTNKRLEENPLKGIKVADFSWVWAGPLTTKTLSDYGAQVIKIEGKSRPDPSREAIPFKDNIPGLNRNGSFSQNNTGKLSLGLNLAHPKGVEIAKRIVAWADIVTENFTGGSMERMGLGYEDLKKVNPDIIMLSTCMQGQTGPHATHLGYGFHLTALSGFCQITGWPDRNPVRLGAYTDFIAPCLNILAILAALDYRQRTGKGQYFDMSQYEGGMHFLAPLILDYVVNGRVADRMGNQSPCAAPHGAYRCRGEDRWCAIAVSTDEEWQSFCNVIGNPAWTTSPKFATLPARKENEEELNRLVEEWTINHSAEEVMTLMQAAGVSAGVVQTNEDLVEHDPHLKHRHYFWEVDHPEVGKYYAYRPPFVLSKAACEVQRAPLLGEHNEYVLKHILGMSDEEIAELVIEGVVE